MIGNEKLEIALAMIMFNWKIGMNKAFGIRHSPQGNVLHASNISEQDFGIIVRRCRR
jgi:hypothetical protein